MTQPRLQNLNKVDGCFYVHRYGIQFKQDLTPLLAEIHLYFEIQINVERLSIIHNKFEITFLIF